MRTKDMFTLNNEEQNFKQIYDYSGTKGMIEDKKNDAGTPYTMVVPYSPTQPKNQTL